MSERVSRDLSNREINELHKNGSIIRFINVKEYPIPGDVEIAKMLQWKPCSCDAVSVDPCQVCVSRYWRDGLYYEDMFFVEHVSEQVYLRVEVTMVRPLPYNIAKVRYRGPSTEEAWSSFRDRNWRLVHAPYTHDKGPTHVAVQKLRRVQTIPKKTDPVDVGDVVKLAAGGEDR